MNNDKLGVGANSPLVICHWSLIICHLKNTPGPYLWDKQDLPGRDTGFQSAVRLGGILQGKSPIYSYL